MNYLGSCSQDYCPSSAVSARAGGSAQELAPEISHFRQSLQDASQGVCLSPHSLRASGGKRRCFLLWFSLVPWYLHHQLANILLKLKACPGPPVNLTPFLSVQNAYAPTFPLPQVLVIPIFFPSLMSLYCYKSSPRPRSSETVLSGEAGKFVLEDKGQGKKIKMYKIRS